MQSRAHQLRCEGRSIAFVPTMGFLHEGHLSLMRIARERADILVASIFVNPTQFAPGEDFEAYPRDMARDLAQAAAVNVDIVFTPDDKMMYPEGFQTYVNLERLGRGLCGLSRPIFFRGVATVVAKLFNIVQPNIAVFGEKDYQQLMIIRRMVRDLNFDIKIVAGAIVREADGLAMSSRNAYLRPEQRPAALSLFQTLCQSQALVRGGERAADAIIAAATRYIESFDQTRIDYIAIVDPESLKDMTIIDRPARMALAVKVGSTRLIDNGALGKGSAARDHHQRESRNDAEGDQLP
jgi:pantoate--beta-alanine ligase